MVAIEGSSSMAIMLNMLKESFQQTYPEIPVSLTITSSKMGLKSLMAKKTDIAAISYFDNTNKKYLNFQKNIIAYDEILPIVNPKLKLKSLNLSQLKLILTGKLIYWPMNNKQIINLYIRNQNSGTYEYIKQSFLDQENFSNKAIIMSDTNGILNSVNNDPYALGFISSSLGKTVSTINITQNNHKIFHIRRPLYFITDQNMKNSTQEFIKFCLHPARKKIILKANFKLNP